jgi:hypothetical protein
MYPIQQINVPLFNAQSIASSELSIVQDVSSCVRLCVQAVWSGTSPVGVLHVQGSNDGIHFNDDPEVTPIAISGNSGSALVKINNCSYPWLQLSYVFTSGTGTLSAQVSGKIQ